MVIDFQDASKKKLLSDNKLLYPYILILFGSSLLITGYAVYSNNQCLQIPLINLLNDPSLYPNDPFGATLPYYASMLWRIVALAARVIPLKLLLITLFLFERLLVIYAAGELAGALVPKSKLAVLGGMSVLALAISSIVGAGTIVTNYFEQTGFSIPFFLLATAAFYKNRPLLFAFWLAIGFNMNSMYGTYAITYLGAVFIFDSNYRKQWKTWLSSFGLFLLLASPAIFLTLSAFGRNATDNQLWITASQIFYPDHFYPHIWYKRDLGRFGFLILFLIAFLYQSRHKVEKLFRHSVIWAAISVFWVIYAYVAAYIAKSPSMLVMHPARGTDLWYCFAGIALVSVCALQVEESKGSKQIILMAFLCATILIWNPSPIPGYMLVVGLIALAWQPVWHYIFNNGGSNRLALLLTLWALFMGVNQFNHRLSQTKSVAAALITQPSSSFEEIAEWARTNTSIDAEFLVDPTFGSDWEQLRSQGKRPVFVTWKDGSAILWDRTYVKPWTERISALGLDITQKGLDHHQAVEKISSLYKNLQDEDVKRIQSRFLIKYWVVPVIHSSTFPIAFQNQSYKVLKLK